jgi:hypothetical protein
MQRRIPLLARAASRSLVVAFAIFAAACATDAGPVTPSNDEASLARGGQQGPDLRAASAAKEKHVDRLLRQSGVEGVGVSLTGDGRPAVVIFTTHGAVGGLPATLEGVPVKVEVTGKIEAILPRAKPGGGGPNPTSRVRPVPVGFSIGNIGECSAGTFGARVVSGGNKYMLSNNHVLALQNEAPLGSTILQPGRYDTNCATNLGDAVATLSKFEPIKFGGANNTVDAAIAVITTAGTVDNKTTPAGYGTPDSDPVAAQVNQLVQKCGRTTGCTKGTVSAISATINVNYGTGIARFVNQVVITGRRGPFSKAGDSGSLIVTDNAAANPVALLFAGGQTTTIGNPIGAVLQAMGVTIDGK